MDLTHKIVRRLLRDDDVSFSRNKNFEAHENELVKRAVRVYRLLRSIERDLLAAGEGQVAIEAVEQDGDAVRVRLNYPSGGGRRESFLTEAEWALLVESTRVREIVSRLLDEAPAATQNRLASSNA